MIFSLQRVKLTTILTGIGLLWALNSLAADKCESLILKLNPQIEISYGQLKKGFKHNSKYTFELTNQSDIKNQCGLGTCHLYSWVSQLEQSYAQNNPHGIKISTHYLSAMHWLMKSLEILDNETSDVSVNLGANVLGSRLSLLRYGIIPEVAWTGKTDFNMSPLSDRINEYIKNIAARTKYKADRVIDNTKKKEIIEQGKNQIRQIFSDLVGHVETSFLYNGKSYNPGTFMKEFFPEIIKPVVLMRVNPGRKDKTKIVDKPEYHFMTISTNVDQLEKTARELLVKGMNVYIGYEHNPNFVNVKSGIMSISAFNFPHEGAPLNREQRAYFKLNKGGHAVQIVGYDLDPKTGKVLKWKIKNSWGEEAGEQGYFHMYNDYFRTFVLSISFFKDAGVELPVAQVIDPEQIEFDF